MVLFGLGFSITAIIGFKGLDVLSRVSVPLMFVLLLVSMYIATRDVGGFAGLAAVVPHETMTFSAAVTMGVRHLRWWCHPSHQLDTAVA